MSSELFAFPGDVPAYSHARHVTGAQTRAEDRRHHPCRHPRADCGCGREDALIAHTRKNAYLIFREDDLGSIQPGKLADLVVIDRDYLTVPADQIKDIKVVMTMVGGRVVHQAGAPSATK